MSSAALSAPRSATRRTDERFTALIRSHRQPLLRYTRSLLPGDPQRAEDAVQETLLRAWLAIPTEAQPRRADGFELGLPWLCTVARNVVIDWSRRDGVRPALPSAYLPETESSADEQARVVDRTHLVELLAPLSRPHREVLVYTYLLGCSGPDTALALGIPTGTVKSRLHHAIRDLRRSAAFSRECA
ncbi:sigma-70 family RNA polymerase sigma factor [Streptomyces sp. H10-C2]|uniref:sigma-70 family RNA polymerase sigma factor n=1 Tax=unclassified Streptomyces TaxID=2593676 RepID=UPI0024B8D773|nr:MULTISPECIES: sigma-70 family RNA polymerase sigma factor [unclassified Streptomyces]MDJ0343359.1 sigma-70 family RNA polymerase sigma factor [Streptomyces sp. PH10-H1]MDJ0371830.1 sigma-70 family RNA polymerase sigma factor [Streptomyces sp. H10-C2]